MLQRHCEAGQQVTSPSTKGQKNDFHSYYGISGLHRRCIGNAKGPSLTFPALYFSKQSWICPQMSLHNNRSSSLPRKWMKKHRICPCWVLCFPQYCLCLLGSHQPGAANTALGVVTAPSTLTVLTNWHIHAFAGTSFLIIFGKEEKRKRGKEEKKRWWKSAMIW